MTELNDMQLAQPLWLGAGIVTCLLLAFGLYQLRRRKLKTLEKFAAAPLLGSLTRHASTRRRRLKSLLLIVAVFLLFLALARPQYGFRWVEVKRKGIDILFALDTSKSMMAEDIKPNRLQRARFGVLDFVSQLEGDRVGLMPFAGTSYLMCPLTLDYSAFTNSLKTITTDIIPRGGTNIGGVIRDAETILNNDANHKILILLTDGENLEGDAIAAARKAAEQGMTIYTVGVGTPAGELIPISGTAQSGFIQDENGQYVTSKLDEQALRAIAEAANGIYTPLGGNGEGLENIYREKLKRIPKQTLAERRHKVPLDRFYWPLLAAILLLAVEFLIGERNSAHALRIPRITTAGRRLRRHLILLPALAAPLLTFISPADAGPAEEAYHEGDYLTASKLYSRELEKRPDEPILQYNYGTTAYKNNLFEEAAASFGDALSTDDLQLQQKAYYNRGNALFQLGNESRQANPQQTIKLWEQALKSYDGALSLAPDDEQASTNRQYVSQQLEMLKQQQQQSNNSNQQPEQKSEGDNNETDASSPEGQRQDNQQQQAPPSSQNDSTSPEEQGQQQQRTDSEQEQGQGQENNQVAPSPQPDQTAPEDTQQASPAAQPEEQNNSAMQAQQRREQGKMTAEEATNLLNALKNEEGDLNFIPRQQHSSPVRRDW